jgi:hypothetical protein
MPTGEGCLTVFGDNFEIKGLRGWGNCISPKKRAEQGPDFVFWIAFRP